MTDPFIHVVFFWLKEPQNSAHRQKFEISITKFMNHSQYAGSWHIGIPAGTDRLVVDNSYTYSLIVTFPSPASHDEYQAEPAHMTFIDECHELWDRVQVYDTTSIAGHNVQ